MTLHEFLAQNHRFGWGGEGRPHRADPEGGIYNDCISFPASWVETVTGVDVVHAFRGTYHSKAEADAIIARAGGMVALAERQLSMVKAKRVQNAQPGDVGIIVAPDIGEDCTHIGAICFGPVWAFLTPSRVLAKQADVVAAWRLP